MDCRFSSSARQLKLCAVLVLFLAALPEQGHAARFEVSVDGSEVQDTLTGLVWLRCVEGMRIVSGSCSGPALMLTHEAALQRAVSVAAATSKAWRVPNVKELASLLDPSQADGQGYINPVAFPATPLEPGSGPHWTATPLVDDPANVFGVSFYSCATGQYTRASTWYLRLVRDGTTP